MLEFMRENCRWLLPFSAIVLCVGACSRHQSTHDGRPTATVAVSSDAATSAQPAVQTESGTLRLVLVYSHELTRGEKLALSQMRRELLLPSKWPSRVIEEPATEDERRFLDEYVAQIEQRAPAAASLPASWLRSETVVAIPIHPPIPLGGQAIRAGFRDLLIFHPPATEAVYATHYRDDKVSGPNLGSELGAWLKRHLQLRAEEVGP